MKTSQKIILLLLIVLQYNTVNAQSNEEKSFVPIIWNELGERKVINCDPYIMSYDKVQPENTYIKVIRQNKNMSEIMMELSTHANQAKIEPIDATYVISLPTNSSSPVTSKDTTINTTRVITLDYIGDRDTVYTGETVRIQYDVSINIAQTYIYYKSIEGGYQIELSDLTDPKVIIFSKRCQSFVVANPALTSIRYDYKVRYEQFVWTPRQDGSWEVRIGTTDRGCKSDALDRLPKLRTKEYEENVPVERK